MERGGPTVHYGGPVFISGLSSPRTPRPHQPNVSEPIGMMVHTGERAIKQQASVNTRYRAKSLRFIGSQCGRRRDRPVAAASFRALGLQARGGASSPEPWE